MTLIQLFTNIANAIRAKTGSSETIKAEDFPTEIADITTGHLDNTEYQEANDDLDDILENSQLPSGIINIMQNGTYDVTNYISAEVNVQSSYDDKSLYTELSYITNNNGAYINTDYYPNYKTKIILETVNNQASSIWFGSWNNDFSQDEQAYKNGVFALANDTTSLYFGYGYSNSGNESFSNIVTGDAVIKMDKNKLYVNDELWYTVINSESNLKFGLKNPLGLFAINRNGTFYNQSSTCSIKSCKIYEDKVLIRDLIACKENSTNIICMYDRANGVFYYNQGSGSFIAGQ